MWIVAAAKTAVSGELSKKSLESALQIWFGNARDRGAGGRKLHAQKDDATTPAPETQNDDN